MYLPETFISSTGEMYEVMFMQDEYDETSIYIHSKILADLLGWNKELVEYMSLLFNGLEEWDDSPWKYVLHYEDFLELLDDYKQDYNVLDEFVPWVENVCHDILFPEDTF